MFFVVKRRAIIASLMIAVIVGGLTTFFTVRAGAFPSPQHTIVIDAGHGGVDGGVTGVNTGVKESDLNLEMAKILGDYLEKAGVKVVYTRKNKWGLYAAAVGDFKREDFERRRDIILSSKPDIMVSIHMNSYKPAPNRRGAQVFYNKKGVGSFALSYELQRKLNEDINKKYSGREYASLPGDYYILNVSDCPAVIVECGFLSNAEDERLLMTDEYRRELSHTIFTALYQFLFTRVVS